MSSSSVLSLLSLLCRLLVALDLFSHAFGKLVLVVETRTGGVVRTLNRRHSSDVVLVQAGVGLPEISPRVANL